MLGSHRLVAFAATKDAARARAFYEGVLGLNVTSDDPFALVFDAAGTPLRLQKVPAFTPQPHTQLGWTVPDVGAAVRDLSARGVAFERYSFLEQDALGVWTTPGGTRVAWFKDPDGNLLSLASA